MMSSILRLAGALALALMSMTVAASAQEQAATPPVIELRPNICPPCQPYLVNRDAGHRLVITLTSEPSLAMMMYDRAGNNVPLGPERRVVLLQAGETLRLPPNLIYDSDMGSPGNPPIRREVVITYQIVGSYVPSPDLTDLAPGIAEDFVRMYEHRVRWLAGSDVCRSGSDAREPRMLAIRNFNPARSIAITFRNGRPESSAHQWTTIYLRPGEDGYVGCIYDLPLIEFREIRYSS